MYDRKLLDSGVTPPPTSDDATVAINGGNNFESNMMIILVALLSALLSAAALYSAARFALRCASPPSGPPSDPAARIDEAVLRRIPETVYGAAGVQIAATECSICLGELREGEKVRILPRCSHGFHVGCIDKWLVLHCSCPLCRQPLKSDASTP